MPKAKKKKEAIVVELPNGVREEFATEEEANEFRAQNPSAIG